MRVALFSCILHFASIRIEIKNTIGLCNFNIVEIDRYRQLKDAIFIGDKILLDIGTCWQTASFIFTDTVHHRLYDLSSIIFIIYNIRNVILISRFNQFQEFVAVEFLNCFVHTYLLPVILAWNALTFLNTCSRTPFIVIFLFIYFLLQSFAHLC